MSTPHVPPLQLDVALPPLELADGPESFRVDEVPSYAASGEGPHWYLRVRKTGRTTQQAISVIARAYDVAPRDVGVAGQKDRDAVTTQWVSVPVQGTEPEAGALDSSVEVLEVSRHQNKLRTGHVEANRFELTFRGDAAEAESPVRDVLTRLASDGMRNYFGPQRFGRGAQNVAKAAAWARGELRLRGKDARFKTNLFASVLQSDVFNRYLTARLALEDPLIRGEVVRLDGSRSVFVVEDVDAEVHRLQQHDIHRTGPMVGPKCRAGELDAAQLEREAQSALELDESAWATVARNAPGTRRDLLVRPTDVGVEVAGPEAIVVRFTLPSGSYATQLARELTRASWERPLRRESNE